jgi:peptidoglycan/LPS O-acetylase OafA/YrhL
MPRNDSLFYFFSEKLRLVAYGTYLLHYLFIDGLRFLLRSHAIQSPVTVLLGAPLLGVAVAVAGISWRVFEKPLIAQSHLYKY